MSIMHRLAVSLLLVGYSAAALVGEGLHLLAGHDCCSSASAEHAAEHDHCGCDHHCHAHEAEHAGEHGTDQPAVGKPHHDPHTCPICQFLGLGQTPLASAAPQLPRLLDEELVESTFPSYAPLHREPYFARGPPAARAA